MEELLRQIETERKKMHNLARQYGLAAPEVLEQSQLLDGLLNAYLDAMPTNQNNKRPHCLREQ
ncbi:aspartyl-phosphate phosphatase Spo0E family protein [Paenibacillus tuaregi]|uniref:aspartyl-phosphate phosphatase Spo0E family protein n=1 Tax=Paenibacillus tuaregi TaxID=1816681 RepID=UPI000839302D|nr:aspartyl-phosphate phosphatase Spo0E family protein [Paenibacillus tuaregi]